MQADFVVSQECHQHSRQFLQMEYMEHIAHTDIGAQLNDRRSSRAGDKCERPLHIEANRNCFICFLLIHPLAKHKKMGMNRYELLKCFGCKRLTVIDGTCERCHEGPCDILLCLCIR